MKLKMIALAAVMAVSGAANATLIDLGNNANTAYNGSLVFSVWDATGSYSLDLSPSIATTAATGIDGINTVVADVTALGSVSFAADSALSSWLAAANTAGLAVQWNVNALGAVATSITNKELLTTANVVTLPAALANNKSVVAGGSIVAIDTGLNSSGISAANELVVTATTAAAGYANYLNSTNFNGSLSFSDAANLGQSMGLAMVGYKGTGTAASTYAMTNLTASVDASGNLTLSTPVAAVPEADTYAMLLAGLGVMGAIVRRRRSV